MKTKHYLLTAGILALTATSARANVTIQTVTIGDVGNPNDPSTGYGSVGYNYAIGTYEVTLLQIHGLPERRRGDGHLRALQSQHGDGPEHRGYRAGEQPRELYLLGDRQRAATGDVGELV